MSQRASCWNEMEELKYLICAMDCCQTPCKVPPPVCRVMLPPRIQEISYYMPPMRPVCRPPPPCCPITCGPCCPPPLPPPQCFPPPIKRIPPPCCPPYCPLPCYNPC